MEIDSDEEEKILTSNEFWSERQRRKEKKKEPKGEIEKAKSAKEEEPRFRRDREGKEEFSEENSILDAKEEVIGSKVMTPTPEYSDVSDAHTLFDADSEESACPPYAGAQADSGEDATVSVLTRQFDWVGTDPETGTSAAITYQVVDTRSDDREDESEGRESRRKKPRHRAGKGGEDFSGENESTRTEITTVTRQENPQPMQDYFRDSSSFSGMRASHCSQLPPVWYNSTIKPYWNAQNMPGSAADIRGRQMITGADTVARSQSYTPNVRQRGGGAYLHEPQRFPVITHVGGNQNSPPLPFRTGSSTPSIASSQGQAKWNEQCSIAEEKAEAYMDAQKLWERMGGLQEIPPGGIKEGISDAGVEVAMRGSNHVLIGIERGARYAGRQWRAMINNC